MTLIDQASTLRERVAEGQAAAHAEADEAEDRAEFFDLDVQHAMRLVRIEEQSGSVAAVILSRNLSLMVDHAVRLQAQLNALRDASGD